MKQQLIPYRKEKCQKFKQREHHRLNISVRSLEIVNLGHRISSHANNCVAVDSHFEKNLLNVIRINNRTPYLFDYPVLQYFFHCCLSKITSLQASFMHVFV